jgi:hypothetical protein
LHFLLSPLFRQRNQIRAARSARVYLNTIHGVVGILFICQIKPLKFIGAIYHQTAVAAGHNFAFSDLCS